MMSRQGWTAGEMLAQAEGSIGSVLNNAVNNYYQGRDLDTAQSIRQARSDTEATKIVTAMRRGRWQDLAAIATVAGLGVGMGAILQGLLDNPRIAGVSPVGALGLATVIAGLAAPVGVPGRAALVAGGTTYMLSAQMYGWRAK